MRVRFAVLTTVLCVTVAACGGSSGAAPTTSASVVPTGAASVPAVNATPTPTAGTTTPPTAGSLAACGLTVGDALQRIAQRVYQEDSASTSERLDLGLALRSSALRAAALAQDPVAARSAATALIRSGHIARLRLTVGGRVLTDVGDGAALAPVSAVLTDAGGTPIGTVLVAVQSGSSFVSTVDALALGGITVRAGSQVLAGTPLTGRAPLPSRGVVTVAGVPYAVNSFPVRGFTGATWRVTLTHRLSSIASLCGATPQDTVRNAVGHSVAQIYNTEAHGPVLGQQAQRVATNSALLAAVAAHDPVATRAAIVALLNQHIVRIRVLAPGMAPVDVGGPYVLGPRTVALRVGGRTVGQADVSIQDDLGLVLLARRLVGVQVVVDLPRTTPVTPAEAQLVASSSLRVGGYRVVLHAGAQPTMTTLAGAVPANLPAQGTVTVQGRPYAVYTVAATAFPSGPLPVHVLVPIPYT